MPSLPHPHASRRRLDLAPDPQVLARSGRGCVPLAAIPALLTGRLPFQPSSLLRWTRGRPPGGGSLAATTAGQVLVTKDSQRQYHQLTDGPRGRTEAPRASTPLGSSTASLGEPSEDGECQAPLRSGNDGFQGFPKMRSFHYSAGK